MAVSPFKPVSYVLRVLIRGYQFTFSAIFGRTCRHLPTCSSYMDDAIVKFGPWAGLWLGISRIVRCGPFGTAGFDPIPNTLPANAKWYFPWRYGLWTGAHMDEDSRLN